MTGTMWRRVVSGIGGAYSMGRLTLVIHDHGVAAAWDGIIRREWKRP